MYAISQQKKTCGWNINLPPRSQLRLESLLLIYVLGYFLLGLLGRQQARWWFAPIESHIYVHVKTNQSINQSIKSSFVKGAGVHPQNALCRRRSHALRKAPVRRGRLLSTVLHRWSPRHYPECRPQINHILSNLASRTLPKSSSAVPDPSSQGLAWTSPYLSHHWNAWHAQTT